MCVWEYLLGVSERVYAYELKIFVLVREKEREGVGVCVVTRFLKQVVVNRCNDGSEVIPTSLMDVYFSSSRI